MKKHFIFIQKKSSLIKSKTRPPGRHNDLMMSLYGCFFYDEINTKPLRNVTLNILNTICHYDYYFVLNKPKNILV